VTPPSAVASERRPLVLHVVYRFDVGGLENGVVNLIDRLPGWRHAVLALTEVTSFRERVRRRDVEYIALHKAPGHAWRLYPALWRTIRRLKPDVVHTRNLAALEVQPVAWAARVPLRVHGEHGRDVDDLDGSSRKYRWLRRAYRPFVQRYVALSRDLADYLVQQVHVPAARVTQIVNGVDSERFRPAVGGRAAIAGCPFDGADLWLVGTVGRMQAVKDQTLLVRAFVLALQRDPALAARLRLVLVGDGPLREACVALLREARLDHLAWVAGARDDVADVMRGLDCFVLPSLAEGVSNTILEAMASGLPVIATAVGGNPELIDDGRSGELVPAGDACALAQAIASLARDPARAAAYGRAARAQIESRFSLRSMVAAYQGVYESKN
jgi:sugar transferase (PEP-CTERM/EpsH1 system associated)